MNTAIVYDSQTGTTAEAAQAMKKAFEAHGHSCQVVTLSKVDPAIVAEADLICGCCFRG